MKRTKQKFLNGCLAAIVALSAALTPGVANAATPEASSTVSSRIGGYDQYATAALMAQKGWTGTSDSVVLSAGMTYSLVDALAAGPLAAKLKAPILLTDNGKVLNTSAKTELLRLKPKKVYITSGTAVIKQSVLDEISALGITPVQLGGFDQYETSVNIAKEMANQGVNITRVILAAGWLSPADALSIAPIAAAQEMPILTTTQGQLPGTVKTYLDSLKAKVTNSYVVGGTAVVSDAVKAQLTGDVKRYFGPTKYDTNIEILKGFAKEYKNDKVYVANGETLVDALAGVPLAAADRSPLVLVNQKLDNATKEFVKLNMSTDDMVALGGEVVVPTAGMNAFTANVSYATDSATVGSADPTKPLLLTDNIKITGNNVTLKNAKADYSVYVKGNNITLSNLTVKGTVFVDPGKTGSATIDGVTAGNIVILSGAPHSVKITNSSTGQITVSSDGDTNVVLTTVTTNGVSVQTAVVYEKDTSGNQVKVGVITITSGAGNNLGEMTITSEPGKTTDVSLSGEFKQPIKVEGQGATTISAATGTVVSNVTSNTSALTLAGTGTYSAVVAQSGTLTAATGTTLPSVTVATTSSTQTVTLAGTMGSVTQTQGNVTLAAGSTVTNMTTTSSSTIIVPPSATITKLESTGSAPPPAIGGGGQVNGQTTPVVPPVIPPVTPPPAGGGGGSSTTPAASVTSITSATTGATIASISGTQITITPNAAAFKQPNIKLDQTATMNIKVDRSGTIYDLGSWNLSNSASGNDIFSVSNAGNLNILNTLDALKATGVQSANIFSAIDFHGVLTAAQGMTASNKNLVYSSLASIFSQASNTSTVNAFYQALNIPGVYNVADANTKTSISNILTVATAGSGVTASQLLEVGTSAAAVATLTSSNQMNTFFERIDFQLLFDALSISPQKEAIFTAISFTDMYNAIGTLDSDHKTLVYIYAALIYQAALSVDAGVDAINYGALLQLVMTSSNTVNLTLTNANGTRTYTVIKGS